MGSIKSILILHYIKAFHNASYPSAVEVSNQKMQVNKFFFFLLTTFTERSSSFHVSTSPFPESSAQRSEGHQFGDIPGHGDSIVMSNLRWLISVSIFFNSFSQSIPSKRKWPAPGPWLGTEVKAYFVQSFHVWHVRWCKGARRCFEGVTNLQWCCFT